MGFVTCEGLVIDLASHHWMNWPSRYERCSTVCRESPLTSSARRNLDVHTCIPSGSFGSPGSRRGCLTPWHRLSYDRKRRSGSYLAIRPTPNDEPSRPLSR